VLRQKGTGAGKATEKKKRRHPRYYKGGGGEKVAVDLNVNSKTMTPERDGKWENRI